MEVIDAIDIGFDGMRAYQAGKVNVIIQSLSQFFHGFTFGKSFILESERYGCGETLNWIISGQIIEDSGLIQKNGAYFQKKDREREVWFVRESTVKPSRFWFREPSVRDQVRYGLQKYNNNVFASEKEVMDFFHLTPERYQRPLRVLSTEKWRASCAIGFVNGKRIFCFPYMDARFITDYYGLWLKEMIDFLKNSGALVLIPTTITDTTKNLCDEIVTFE